MRIGLVDSGHLFTQMRRGTTAFQPGAGLSGYETLWKEVDDLIHAV